MVAAAAVAIEAPASEVVDEEIPVLLVATSKLVVVEETSNRAVAVVIFKVTEVAAAGVLLAGASRPRCLSEVVEAVQVVEDLLQVVGESICETNMNASEENLLIFEEGESTSHAS